MIATTPLLVQKNVHEFVISQLVAYVFRKKDVDKLTKGLNKYVAKQMPDNAKKIKENLKSIKSIENRRKNLLSAIEDGIADDDVKKRLGELTYNKDELLAEIEQLENEVQVAEITADETLASIAKLKAYLLNNPTEARKLIDKYVQKVIVHKETIEVILKSSINLADKYDPSLNEGTDDVA